MKKERINKVILSLTQDLQRLLCALQNSVRGRFQIKFGMTFLCNKAAFTLMEMLLVVLIVGILTAVALPMYQRAVFKSRFSKLMLPAKSLASANEAFFLGNGEYATAVASLDVGGEDANLPDGSTVDLQDTNDASFVRLSNAEVPNARYVVYQQKSANFAGTTMCEAQGDDSLATWLCDKGLNGTLVEDAQGNNGANGWTAYLLTGTVGQNDQFGAIGNEQNEPELEPEPTFTLEQLQALATEQCPSGKSRYICTIDSENGTVSKCDTDSGTINAQGECVSNGINPGTYETVYNPDGTLKQEYKCGDTYAGHCYYGWFHDSDTGSAKFRMCYNKGTIGKDFTCSNGYNTSGNTDYTYDSHGNLIDYGECSSVNAQGVCTAYGRMYHYDNTYDTKIGYVQSQCTSISGTTCVDNNYKNMYAQKKNGTSEVSVACFNSTGGGYSYIFADGTCSSGYVLQQKTVTNGQSTLKSCTSYNTIDWENATCD